MLIQYTHSYTNGDDAIFAWAIFEMAQGLDYDIIRSNTDVIWSDASIVIDLSFSCYGYLIRKFQV